MKRRTRLVCSLLFLAAALAGAFLLDVRVRPTFHLFLEHPLPGRELRLFLDRGEGFGAGPVSTLRVPEVPAGREAEVHFELPAARLEGLRVAWDEGQPAPAVRAAVLRKLWRTWTVEGAALDGVFRRAGPASAVFAPEGLDRFSVIGLRFLVPYCLAAAFLLYLALGLRLDPWLRYRELVGNLTRVQLTLKYRGSLLGFVWSLLNPLLMLAIYSVAFRYIMRIQLDNYTFFLLSGLLPWNFLSMTLLASTTSVLGNAGLLKKAAFPREVFPISTTLFVFVQFLLSVVAIGPFCLLWKTHFAWFNLLYFAGVGALLLFSLGVAYLLSALTVLYRDMQHFTEVGIMALFWLSPIVYHYELVPPSFRWLFLLNPITVFMNGFHDVIYWNRLPDGLTCLAVLAWPLAALAAGSWVFRRIDPRFAEVL